MEESDDMLEGLKRHIDHGTEAYLTVLAQVLLVRADSDATVALICSIVENLPEKYRPAFQIAEEFGRIRKERIEALLDHLEDSDPEVAARIQRVLDGS